MVKIILQTVILLFLTSPILAQLNGTYTVDPNGGGDYQSLTAAATDLNSQGMNGNVTLKLATAVYAEQVLFAIPGQTSGQMLTIESQSGNEQDVVIRFEEATEESNYQLAFEGIQALTIQNITINTADLENGTGINFTGECANILIDNLHHDGNRNDPGIVGYYLDDIFEPTYPIHHVTVVNSYFHEASMGISFGNGILGEPVGGFGSDMHFNGNTFFDSNGISVQSVTGVTIADNVMYGEVYEINPLNMYRCKGEIQVINNNIWQSSFDAFKIDECEGTTEVPVIIANNFISGTGNLIHLWQNSNLLFAHNSVYCDDDELSFVSTLLNTDTRILNNIFYQNHPEGGIFMVLEGVEATETIDYNCLYSNGFYAYGGYVDGVQLLYDFEEYTDETGQNEHGISVLPLFTIPGEDLHTSNEALNAGIPLTEVTTDIDGETRDTTNPSIGADEIDGVVIVTDLTIDTVTTSGDLNGGDELTIMWSGQNTGALLFQAPWKDRIFISDDQQLDASDILLSEFEVTENLNAGDAYSHQKIIELPLNLMGTKFVIIKVNADANLIEDASNNTAVSEPIYITPPPLPNLVVTDINLPENVLSGTQLQFEYTVTNIGDAPASGNWKDLIWQEDFLIFLQDSREHHHQTRDPWGTKDNPVGLMPGESYVGTFTKETPYAYHGYSYIRIETDGYDNIIEELDENDNFVNALIDSVFINQSPLADLIVTDIQVPSESFSGEEITISYTVKNNGTETTSPAELPYNFYFGWTWGAFASDWLDYTYFSDTTFSFTPSQYKRVGMRDGNLNVDSTYVVHQTFRLPKCEHGPYFVTIYADRWNHVAELDEENNSAISDTIHIIPRPAPDLIPTSGDPVEGLASNTSYTLSYHVENQGADTAFANWKDRVFLSDSDTFQFDISEMIADTLRTQDLAVDMGYDTEIVINVPPDQYGSKYIYLWIDAANQVCEQPYDNNNILKIPVEIAQSPSADLQIDYYPPSDSYVAGDDIDLSAVTTNIGSAEPNITQWKDRIFLKSELSNVDSSYTEVYTHTGGLDPDISYPFPNPFTIPLDFQPGFYSIGIVTDYHNDVWENEAEENNSILSDPFQITIDSSRTPDLRPVSLSPQAWNTSENYTIEVLVQNAETATGIATWVDKLTLRDTLGHTLAKAISIFSGNIDHNGEYTATFEMEIPSGTPENAVFTVKIDTSNAIFEYQKSNNTRAFPIAVHAGPAPDLVPASLQVNEQINAGQEMMLSVFRNNYGTVAVQNQNWIDRILLSHDNIPDESDITLRSYSFLSENMGAESTTVFSDSIKIPLTLVGNYYVIYFMDADNQVAEGGMEGNNYVVSTDPLQIQTPAPVDFSSTFLDISIDNGNPRALYYELKNTGTNAFTGKFYNTWYLSEDAEYDPTDLVLGRDQVADYDNYGHAIILEPGETSNESAGFIYQPVVEGDYYIIQKIDAFLNVYETDEQNNTVAFGPFHIDNIPEIFPDVTYEKQFGRNPVSFDDWWYLGGIPIPPGFSPGYDPGPDRHDYKINIPDDYGMVARMWENEEANEIFVTGNGQPVYEMYVGENYVPDPLHFDFRHDSPMQADQTVIVPVADERTDYIKTHAAYIPPHYDPSVSPESKYFLRADFKQFSVFDLSPEIIGNSHNVTMRITGFDLEDEDGLDVALLTGTDTIYAFETYPQNPSELVAYIDMRGYEAGEYKLMVRKRSTWATTIWEEPVQVIEDEGALLFTDVQAPAILRTGSDIPISVTYGNHGHSNIYDMVVFVAFFMDDSTTEGLSVDYLGSTYPGYTGNGYISTVDNPAEPVDIAVFDDAIIFMAYVPIVHARSSESFVFRVRANVTGTVLTTQSTLGLVQRSPYTFTGRVADAGQSMYARLLGKAIASSQGALEGLAKSGGCDAVLDVDVMSQRLAEQTYEVAKIARGASSTEKNLRDGYKALFDTKASIKERYDAIKGAIDEGKKLDLTANEDTPFYSELNSVFNCLEMEGETVVFQPVDYCHYIGVWQRDGVEYRVKLNTKTPNGNCITPPNITPKKRKLTELLNALDPNEIVGPNGSGPARLVDGEESFTYTIYFENMAEATAPATRVRIDNPLDTNLRMQSLRVVSFGFADTSFQFNNSAFVQQTIDLGNKFQNQQLRILGGTNPQTGKAFFEFTTLNPETQGIATGAYDGFLWPNDSTGRGEGYITYMIDPLSDLEAGTQIRNKAAIIFDDNEIIETNTWTNTISGGELASRVFELPEYSATTFQLEWTSETPKYAPSVESFDIYFRDLDGEKTWEKWLGGTRALKKDFNGIAGHTYEFYSRAKSNIDYEEISGEADARTTIYDFRGVIDGDEPILFPNPATDKTSLGYRSSGENIPMMVRIFDIQGKQVYTHRFTTPGNGIQVIQIPIRNLSAGMYVVDLYENDSRRGGAKLIITGNLKP